jgi:hypothetical protein
MVGESRLLHAISSAGAIAAGQNVEQVEASRLVAHCSPLDDRAVEGDPTWLAAAAQRHHGIVQQLFAVGPVLPVRFGTVVELAAIEQLLTRYQADFSEELERLNGLAEWGVKLIARSDVLRRGAERCSAVRNLDVQIGQSNPGRAYLLKRQREAAIADALQVHRRSVVEQIDGVLAKAALQRAELPLPDVMPADGEVLANLAFLVPVSAADRFAELADAAAVAAEIQLELTGPWPPYSFVRLSLAEDQV